MKHIKKSYQQRPTYNPIRTSINNAIENTNNGKFSSAFSIYTTLVVKYIERIADHAVNIAEWVIYILNGYHKDKQIF